MNGKISAEQEYYIYILLDKFRWSNSIFIKSGTGFTGEDTMQGMALCVHHPMRRYQLNFTYPMSRVISESKGQLADVLFLPIAYTLSCYRDLVVAPHQAGRMLGIVWASSVSLWLLQQSQVHPTSPPEPFAVWLRRAWWCCWSTHADWSPL